MISERNISQKEKNQLLALGIKLKKAAKEYGFKRMNVKNSPFKQEGIKLVLSYVNSDESVFIELSFDGSGNSHEAWIVSFDDEGMLGNDFYSTVSKAVAGVIDRMSYANEKKLEDERYLSMYNDDDDYY